MTDFHVDIYIYIYNILYEYIYIDIDLMFSAPCWEEWMACRPKLDGGLLQVEQAEALGWGLHDVTKRSIAKHKESARRARRRKRLCLGGGEMGCYRGAGRVQTV